MKIPIIVIVGPTASGKTALSVAIAKKYGGEIISADSMQIYRDMHIASAAPDEEEKEGITHHLFEFLGRDESYSVAEYVKDASNVIREIYGRGKLPVIVGGTGLYINSLIDNVHFTEEETDPTLRASLEREYDTVGGEEMIKKLSAFDPKTAEKLHPNNKKRIIRAFEVYMQTGLTITEQNAVSKLEESPFEPCVIGLKTEDRQYLYDRINLRVDIMLENGLLQEAEKAYKMRGSATSAQAIGHKEFFPYFNGEASLEETVETLKMETRRYAKRQLTWFSRDERINWINIDKTENALAEASIIIERKLCLE